MVKELRQLSHPVLMTPRDEKSMEMIVRALVTSLRARMPLRFNSLPTALQEDTWINIWSGSRNLEENHIGRFVYTGRHEEYDNHEFGFIPEDPDFRERISQDRIFYSVAFPNSDHQNFPYNQPGERIFIKPFS
jgi:hypothetical protein